MIDSPGQARPLTPGPGAADRKVNNYGLAECRWGKQQAGRPVSSPLGSGVSDRVDLGASRPSVWWDVLRGGD